MVFSFNQEVEDNREKFKNISEEWMETGEEKM
jgi:hypothetical protein